MKKTLLFVALLCFAQLSFAQYFTLTSDGFKSADKTDYVVVNIANTKQAELYRNVLNALSTMYKNPKEVLSLVEGEAITIKGYEEDVIDSKDKASPIMIGKTKKKYDISYTLSILFKDSKIRFNSPTFDCRRWIGGYNAGWVYMSLVKDKKATYSVYNKKGELVAEEAAASLNKHFNALIKEILDKSNKINNW